jgi:2-oxoglutarate/2-oxoacid ferredoxin oxidoreductase subunit beta
MSEATLIPPVQLTRKDFITDQEVRWCPGCGDYAILAQMQKVLPELGIPRENIVFISGIGCSSRFPYYMNTYGVHSIHGRAPTLATGLNVVRPDLQVWVVTGDGDGLSIGGNHLVHCLRRNVDVRILLFNNRIYGLTKGQYSPTSLPGHVTKSSPMGSIEASFNPISVALAAEGTFIARTVDVFTKHEADILKKAASHRGCAFVEIYQNCIIFNGQAWDDVTDAGARDENVLYLEHGQPMIFGKNKDKGIRLNGAEPEVVKLGENGITEADLLVHDAHSPSPNLAYVISRMEPPRFPVPIGIFRQVEHPTYPQLLENQIETARQKLGTGDLKKLYHAADTWQVTESGNGASPSGNGVVAGAGGNGR